MKRLLLPLLAAIALPTAVEANWFSGDLVWKNSVGEKTIIKKGTIRLEKLTVNEKHDEFFVEYRDKKNDYNREIWKRTKWMKRIKSEYAECFRAHAKGELKNNGSYLCSRFDYIKRLVDDETVIIDEQKRLKKSHSDKVRPIFLNYANWIIDTEGNEVVETTIYYTPIFEDLNGIRTVGYRERVVCDNPFIDFSSLKISGGNKGLSSLERKICKKYAKFK